MIVYVVIEENRHMGVGVEVFTSQADAVEYAEAIADEYDNAVVELDEGWIYSAQLNDEGDYVSVRERRLRFGPGSGGQRMNEPPPLPDWAQWLVPGWAGCGPWVPTEDLTPEGQAIRAEFLRMLRWDRRAVPYLKEIVAELEKLQ